MRKQKSVLTPSQKLGKNEPVRLDILMKIADALDCKVEDLFETVRDTNNSSN